MPNIVVKIDSTVATPEKIEKIADRLIEQKNLGNNIVAVVPPLENLEDRLLQFSQILSDNSSEREQHALNSLNTQVASNLLAISLIKKGVKAISLNGWQAGIEVAKSNQNVLIAGISHEHIIEHLSNDEIVIVAGSQGVDKNRNILEMGEGGPETTAVAIGAAINAEHVEILTVQDGIYTADPRVVKQARKLKQITYDEMLELANLGASYIHPRAVELAKIVEIPIVVRSSTENIEGTMIKGEVDMERNLIVRGVAYEADIIRLTVGYDSYEQSSLADIFTTLAEHKIDVDIIVQAVIDGVKPTVSFSIAKEDFAEAIKVLEKNKTVLGFSFADFEVGLAKVSIVGAGMVSNPGVAARMFDRLRNEKILVKMVSTSEIKVSVVVPQDEMVRAANVLHDEFNLMEVIA
ncbi:aspartate kinase [Lysinibacillus sp. SGAir0095]|uniref:aspartate kinase n=1 Tax=Lysinibacillus sp. SGAir0095 TaxID=2070463 RepID=UPI0010CD2879|nr:aspartate kinase [Lysinibacillus sp. SGAir0095]QCR33179.1 aspartate kinase [Lysinibacillus sp. SGAir0095]